jgi:hypothetical protein
MEIFHILLEYKLEGVAGPRVSMSSPHLNVVIVVEVVATITEGKFLIRDIPIEELLADLVVLVVSAIASV